MEFIPVKVAFRTSTFIFYLAIILFCYFIAAAGKKTILVSSRLTNNRKGKELWLILISAILIFIKGFGTTGHDLRIGYYLDFLSATSIKQFRSQSVEIGYRMLNIVIRKFTDEYWVLILIISILTICPIIHIVNKYSDKIDVPVAVMFYISCFFFSGFSPLRQALAASIALVSFDAIIEEKPYKAILWTFIAALFHVSALAMLFPIIILSFKKINKYFIAFILLLMFCTVYFGRFYISDLLSESERYSIYSSFTEVHIGAAQLFYYLPIFAVYIIGRKEDKNYYFSKVSFSYIAFGFCCGLLGYIISIFGRLHLFLLPLIIILAYYSKLCKKRFPQFKVLINFLIFFYCISRFSIYIIEYVTKEDLMPYTNIFAWVI